MRIANPAGRLALVAPVYHRWARHGTAAVSPKG
jgi:hypothetical protein